MSLQDDFDKYFSEHFNNLELNNPLFYRFPIGIRFEIGVGDTYNEAYVNAGFRRALAVFYKLFSGDDTIYVVVNSFEDDPNDLADNDISTVRPLIKHSQNECKFTFTSKVDDFSCERYIFETAVHFVQIKELLLAILWSDIDRRNTLRGCVYLINPNNDVIYFLYDDMGLDVISNSRETLEVIYTQYNDWILDCDRKKIDEVFAI